MTLPEYPIMSVEDYLILDRNSQTARYEYLDGELRMLAGGSNYHAALIANLIGILGRQLENTSCWIYSSDVHLQLSKSRYFHPDVTVSCDQRDHEQGDMIHHPCIVIEVLSPSTEAIDRGKKFFSYQACPTIQDYVMVDSQCICVEVYHREEGGWKLRTYGPGGTVRLESLAIQFSVDTLYKGMKLAAGRDKDL